MMDQCLTVGILYPGEMGAALGALLRGRGARVVTTLRDRSEHTALRCREAGVIVLADLEGVVRQSDVVISTVSPAAAESVAAEYCELARHAPTRALFVDANSTGPELASSLADRVSSASRGFVDAAIHGQARALATEATLYLSGGHADEIVRLFDGTMRTRLLGTEPGAASAMKMLLGGLSKGLCALFTEVSLLAERRGMSAAFMEESARFYPGVATAVHRMLPTYPKHAVRRAAEMREIEKTSHSSGQSPCVLSGVRGLLEELGRVPFDLPSDQSNWTIESIVKHLRARAFLADASSSDFKSYLTAFSPKEI